MGDISESDSRYRTSEAKEHKISCGDYMVSKQDFWVPDCRRMEWDPQTEWEGMEGLLPVGSRGIANQSGLRTLMKIV